MAEAIDVGVSQFVTKPVKLQKLHEAVRRCYDSIIAERDLRKQNERVSLLSRALEENPSAVAIVGGGRVIEYVTGNLWNLRDGRKRS